MIPVGGWDKTKQPNQTLAGRHKKIVIEARQAILRGNTKTAADRYTRLQSATFTILRIRSDKPRKSERIMNCVNM